jgi:hypothetical protein
MQKKLIVKTGGGAAWRARYVYWGESFQSARKIAHLGIDPTASRPNVFGSLLGHEFRFEIPRLGHAYPASPLRRKAYELQSRILCGLDGRYGWGTKRP